MGGEEPKPGLVWPIELGKLLGEPCKGEQSVETAALRLGLPSAPARNRLRSRAEQLRDLPTLHASLVSNRVELAREGGGTSLCDGLHGYAILWVAINISMNISPNELIDILAESYQFNPSNRRARRRGLGGVLSKRQNGSFYEVEGFPHSFDLLVLQPLAPAF